MKQIFAIGDSHTFFFGRTGLTKFHWLGVIDIATIYQLLKKGLDIYNLKDQLAKSLHYTDCGIPEWQCPSGVYDIDDVKEGDTVLFFYGFNDIQKNINKYHKDEPEKEINRLIDSYLSLLKGYEAKYNITCIPCSIPPNPLSWSNKENGEEQFGCFGDFIAIGTSEIRNYYTKYANDLLEYLCPKYNLKYFDIYNEISKDGFIRKDYTSDYVHLDYENIKLVELIKEKLNELISR